MPPFDDPDVLGVETEVVHEAGRWVVYLVTTHWNAAAPDGPLERRRIRVRDHASAADAEVTRRWTERGATRTRRLPPLGS